MAGTAPEDVARAFRVAGESADLRKNEGMLAAICDRDIQEHILAAEARHPAPPLWSRQLSRPKGSRARSITALTPLIFSGQLRQSMYQRPKGGEHHVQTVSVGDFTYGSNLNYAHVVHSGGRSLFKIDPSHLPKGYKSGKPYVRLQIEPDVWRTKRITMAAFPINVRPRPFCYLSPEAQYRIAEKLGEKIERDWEKA